MVVILHTFTAEVKRRGTKALWKYGRGGIERDVRKKKVGKNVVLIRSRIYALDRKL